MTDIGGRGTVIGIVPNDEAVKGPVYLRDPEAFRSFYRTALPRVYGFLLARCGGDAPMAEELTQETFVAAVDDLRRGVTPTAPLPWVLGIARHKLVDHYRRQARARPFGGRLDGVIDRLFPHERLVPIDDVWTSPHERTTAALALLPAAQRAALVLRHVDDLPVPEIAALLGRSVHAVESLLARGRVGFKRHYLALSDAEVDDGKR